MTMLETVELNLTENPSTSIIWLHGLGADGHDFYSIVPAFNFAKNTNFRFVFPHAPVRPITINQGYEMRAWYDITGTDLKSREDEKGIRQSALLINNLIEQEHASGIAYENIILAGFSQGGAMALYCGLRYSQRLGGIISLSAYLPLAAALPNEANSTNQSTPIFMAHGVTDPMVPLLFGEFSKQALLSLNYQVEWRTYPMQHSVCSEEVSDIREWLLRVAS